MMGHGASQANVVYFLSALEVIFKKMGYRDKVGAGVSACANVFSES